MFDALNAWGQFAKPEPLLGGHRNLVFKVQFGARVFVAKTSRRSEAALRWLEPVFDHAVAAGFRVPRLVPSLRGNLLESGWTVEPFLEGRGACADEILRIRPMVEDFHRYSQKVAQRPGFCSAKELVVETVSGDIDLKAMPDELVLQLRAAWRVLPDAETVIHADLCGGNIVIHPNLPPALIDWDEARRDAALFDYDDTGFVNAKAALEIASCWCVEPKRARKLAQSWRPDRGSPA